MSVCLAWKKFFLGGPESDSQKRGFLPGLCLSQELVLHQTLKLTQDEAFPSHPTWKKQFWKTCFKRGRCLGSKPKHSSVKCVNVLWNLAVVSAGLRKQQPPHCSAQHGSRETHTQAASWCQSEGAEDSPLSLCCWKWVQKAVWILTWHLHQWREWLYDMSLKMHREETTLVLLLLLLFC